MNAVVVARVLSFALAVALLAPGVAQADIRVLPPLGDVCNDASGRWRPNDDEVEQPAYRLAGGGEKPGSPIHMACADRRGRLNYSRFVPGQGVVERVRPPGSELHPAESDTYDDYQFLFAIASWGRTVYLAWLGDGPGDSASFHLATRRGRGRWSIKRAAATAYPSDLALAGNRRGAYLAWTERWVWHDGINKPALMAQNVHLASFEADGRVTRTTVPYGWGNPCALVDPRMAAPSIALTSKGPLIAVTEVVEVQQIPGTQSSCPSDWVGAATRLAIKRVVRGELRSFPSPDIPDGGVAEDRILFNSGSGIGVTYRSLQSRATDQVLLSRLVDGRWTAPETVATLGWRELYGLVFAGERWFVAGRPAEPCVSCEYRDYDLAERTASGWSLTRVGVAGDIVASGDRLYFNTYETELEPIRLGRAVID